MGRFVNYNGMIIDEDKGIIIPNFEARRQALPEPKLTTSLNNPIPESNLSSLINDLPETQKRMFLDATFNKNPRTIPEMQIQPEMAMGRLQQEAIEQFQDSKPRALPMRSIPQSQTIGGPGMNLTATAQVPTSKARADELRQQYGVAPRPDPLSGYNAVMNREPGFFQENAPLILGLLGGVSGLLEAMGPSRTPVSSGQVFARGLQSGLGGYMGGLKYQQGQDQARQTEGSNILKALEQKQGIQASLDRRKNQSQMRMAIPRMIQDVSDLENLTANDKVRIQIAKRLGESSPTSAFNILNEIAGKTEQFGFINTGDGTVIRTNKMTGESEVISGDKTQASANIGSMPYEDIPAKSETERALLALNSAPKDSLNYKIAYDLFSRPQMSSTGSVIKPNMKELGFIPPQYQQTVSSPAINQSKSSTDTLSNPSGAVIQSANLGPATVTKMVQLKPVPVGEKRGIRDLNRSLGAAKRALNLLNTSEDARDAVGVLDQFKFAEGPDFLSSLKTTKDGKALLADISDIQSLTLLERSGAAVTVPEFQRARPFLPEKGDSEDTLKGKLERLIEIYSESVNSMFNQYNPDQGYRDISVFSDDAPNKKPSSQEIINRYQLDQD